MSAGSKSGISFSFSQGHSLLNRALPLPREGAFSEIQSEVDGLVGGAVSAVSDEKTMASLFAAGLAGRFIRLGGLAASGPSLAPWLARGLSHGAALAGESAVFAAAERKFSQGHVRWEGFPKDWARAAITLGSLKLFGGLARGENLILQHLLTDAGMVAGHHFGGAAGVMDRPQGSLARQMIQAEGMNLSMKGSLALLHGLSPRLSALEKSLDMSIRSNAADLSGGPYLHFLSEASFGEPDLVPSEGSLVWMSERGEGPKGPGIPGRLGAGPPVPAARTTTIPRPKGPPSAASKAATRTPLPPPKLPPPPPPAQEARPPIPRPTIPRPTASRSEESVVDRPQPVRLSFTPPAQASVPPMSQDQILLLSRTAQGLQGPAFQAIPFAMIAAELSHAGFAVQAKEYFDYAGTLIDALPDPSPLKGTALSHLALERARVGNPEEARASFRETMQVLNRLQASSQKTSETLLSAYGLVFQIAGDLIAAGRADTALQFLSIASPNYQRVLKGPIPLSFGEEAVLKLTRYGQIEDALVLAGQIPNQEGQRKILLKLGRLAAERREMKKAEEILWRLRGHEEKDTLHAEVARAYALNNDWVLSLQNVSAIKEVAFQVHMTATLARIASFFENGGTARTLQDEAARSLQSYDDLLSPEDRAAISAVLAGNYSLWGEPEGHSRYYYRALGELDLDRNSHAGKDLGERTRKSLAEIVFGLQIANEGEKIGEVLKPLDRSDKSSVLGETALKLTQAGRIPIANAWLGLIPPTDRSEPQRKAALQLSAMGYAEQALSFAERIPDPGLRFETLWEICARNRGDGVPDFLGDTSHPPTGAVPPPLPKGSGK